MLKNKETTTFHPPPRKESSDQQDLIIDKHRFQILDKSRAKERKTALITCSDGNFKKMQHIKQNYHSSYNPKSIVLKVFSQ